MLFKLTSLVVVLIVAGATAATAKDVYNIVVLGSSGVGKSSLLNMFAGEDVFVVGNSAMSETAVANSHTARLLAKPDGLNLRLVDTQGLSDSGGDTKDMQHIRNMVEYIKQLGHVDMFLICFDGQNPRFSSYAQSTIALFRQIFPDFLNHSVLVFNKWVNPDPARIAKLRSDYQTKIRADYGHADTPCFFIDSFFNRKMLRDNADGSVSDRYLHPNIQKRTMEQINALAQYLSTKETTCDVSNIEPKDTEQTRLLKEREQAERELADNKRKYEEALRSQQEEQDRLFKEAREQQERELDELRKLATDTDNSLSGIEYCIIYVCEVSF